MKIIILLALGFFLLFSTASMAKLNYYNPYNKSSVNNEKIKSNSISRSLIITPISKCYKRLDKKTATEIKKNYIKPYKECLNRIKLKEKHRKIRITKDKKP